MKKILVTGAFGLVGTDLVQSLQQKYGGENIVSIGHSNLHNKVNGIIEQADVRDKVAIDDIIKKHDIKTVYHLAGLLSVGSEKSPHTAWEVNLGGLKNILDLAAQYKLQMFWPSSIAAFGPTTPKDNTPQHTILEPTTMYGMNKVAGELLCQYYFLRYGVDVRSLRYPGLNGWKATPGDGTTEYAIHIFYSAIKEKRYECFLKEDTVLPMMYMDDAIKATIDIMEADAQKITIRTSYNLSAISFSPKDLVNEIKHLLPEFICSYNPDQRQAIADSWPRTIDDTQARLDWGWSHTYDLAKMTKALYENIKVKVDSQ